MFGYLKNKLFVVGYENNEFEVFDNFCKKFVSPTHSPSITYSKCLPIGKKIVLFKEFGASVIYYDVDKDKWFEDSSKVTEDLEDFSCVKLPWY